MNNVQFNSPNKENKTLKSISKKTGRITKHSKAVIECYQEIPCNVCELACHTGALEIGTPLSNTPTFNSNKCTGCGLCVITCPGLAIFLVDPDYSNTEALVSFPYEYLPIPIIGSKVDVINHHGQIVGIGHVLEIKESKKFDSTRLVTVAIPKELVSDVRGITNIQGGKNAEV